MRRALVVLVLLAGALVWPASPARAHAEDPQVVTVLDGVTPELPGVTVSVLSGVAPQLLLVNTTRTAVDVMDENGRAFLRIGPDDVQVDLARVAAYQDENPFGAAGIPDDVLKNPAAPARFSTVATGSSYGWFDHRMHPTTVTVPDAVRTAGRVTRLSDFIIPLQQGPATALLRGHLEFRPQLGGFVTRSDGVPDGLQAVVLQAALPGLAVSAAAGRTVVVMGAAGEPFARLSPAGAEVNTKSPTWAADAEQRGVPPTPTDPGAEPQWQRVSSSPTLTWLDARLRWPDQLPPDAALASSGPTVLGPWSIPVTVDGAAATLSGSIVWQPDPARARPTAPAGSRAPFVVGGVALAVAAAGAAKTLRRRTRVGRD